MPRQPIPRAITPEALLAADFLDDAQRLALAELDTDDLWRRGYRALATALDWSCEYRLPGYLTPAEFHEAARIRQRLGLPDD